MGMALVQARHALTNNRPRTPVALWQLRIWEGESGPYIRRRKCGRNPIIIAEAWSGDRQAPKWLHDLGVAMAPHVEAGKPMLDLVALALVYLEEIKRRLSTFRRK